MPEEEPVVHDSKLSTNGSESCSIILQGVWMVCDSHMLVSVPSQMEATLTV